MLIRPGTERTVSSRGAPNPVLPATVTCWGAVRSLPVLWGGGVRGGLEDSLRSSADLIYLWDQL